jgi:hypothetical protein
LRCGRRVKESVMRRANIEAVFGYKFSVISKNKKKECSLIAAAELTRNLTWAPP